MADPVRRSERSKFGGNYALALPRQGRRGVAAGHDAEFQGRPEGCVDGIDKIESIPLDSSVTGRQ
jgi:hypothetical protein